LAIPLAPETLGIDQGL